MEYLWATLLVLLAGGCLFLTLLGLPGNWLMLLVGIAGWWLSDWTMFAWGTLLAAGLLAGLGELLELLAGLAGTRRAGGSRRASLAAIAGGVAGAIVGTAAIPIPVVGTLLGAAGGAFLLAMLVERGRGVPSPAALRTGLGAGVGQLLGTLAKTAVGAAIWVLLTVAAYWP